jgi:anaerobic ribonucleoside-triphosphate reductase activating protein
MSKTNTGIADLINYLDVIVDGKYIDKLHSHDYKYRGSSNQRLIDVHKSLTTKKTIPFPTE